MQFENNWLARYPRPNQVIFDPGTEFKGEFRDMLRRHGIHPSPTTVKNPQANSICERLHQTVADVLRPLLYAEPPQHSLEAANVVDTALATAAYAARSSIHSTMKISPGAAVFQRDMLLDIPVMADFQLLKEKRQQLIDKNLARANRKRVAHDYAVGDQCLKLVYKPDKLQPKAEGPYTIERMHGNGSATIRILPLITERINLRRLRPYWS
jgi:hypothetical protein